MPNLENDLKKVFEIFNNSLVVGNHDTISLLGAKRQNELNDYSKKFSQILLNKNVDINEKIINTIENLISYEKLYKIILGDSILKTKKFKELKNEYEDLLSIINNVSLSLNLHKTQLIKEEKKLEKLNESIKVSSKKLERIINKSNDVLNSRFLDNQTTNLLISKYDEDYWYSRLERKIENLYLSLSGSMQIQAQIKLLLLNDSALIENINSLTINVFPIWKDQLDYMLKLGKINYSVKNSDHVANIEKDLNLIIKLEIENRLIKENFKF